MAVGNIHGRTCLWSTSEPSLNPRQPYSFGETGAGSSTTSPSQLLDIPPEIWEQIGAFSTRSSLVRLCAVSLAFHSVFSSLLWAMTAVLDSHRRLLLVKMLAESTWGLSEGLNDLVTLLRTPGYFPHLKALSIDYCEVEDAQTRVDFLEIPGLEELECSFQFSSRLNTHSRSRGGTVMQSNKGYATWHDSFQPPSPWEKYAALFEIMNRLRFLGLVSFDLSVDCIGCDQNAEPQCVDPSAFVRGHPTLTDLALGGTGLSTTLDLGPGSLPGLRTMRGPLRYCATVSTHARDLEQLSISLEQRSGSESPAELDLFTPNLFSPGVGPWVKRLTVHSEGGKEPTPSSVHCLARAFTHVTRLDLRLPWDAQKGDHDYYSRISTYYESMVGLQKLEYVCLRSSTYIETPNKEESATVLFPPNELEAQINRALLPSLPALAGVDLFFEAHRATPYGDGDSICCPCCDWDISLSSYDIEYGFGRRKGEMDLGLVKKKISGEDAPKV
ncbi:hypothetical protein B0H16DRAFT_1721128 [Mycena metata]|uniref:F-box domain-containing protein n=1 Tax=Mycena metata TaxID=1033252 RepID=A0AAD7JAA8_9AGAR|nr:hypothetical protein B0H16DRAFT_1721128 [Mycena metata]